MKPNIISENNDFIIVEKPCGLPSQPDKTGDSDMCGLLKEYWNGKDVFVVHRLDRAVSGIMVYAKTKEAAGLLSKALEESQFSKSYIAVVMGSTPQSAELTDYLIKNQRLNISKIVHQNEKNAKEAKLAYKKIAEIKTEADGILSLLEISLLTGRHHQIRVQLANAGFPIWGDTKYNNIQKKSRDFIHIALFAHKLSFRYKKKDKSFALTAPITYPFDLFT